MSLAICQENKDLPDHLVLGNLLFYSLSDMKISESDLLNLFQTHSIPVSYIKKISKADAFRRATSSIKNSSIFLTDDSTGEVKKVKIEVDEIKSDSSGIKRVLGFKDIDSDNEDISYTAVGTMTFDRASEQSSFVIDDIRYLNNKAIEDVLTEASDNYREWAVYHNKDTVRNIINRIVADTHPVSLTQSGLCKFVPKSHKDLLYGLKDAILELRGFSSSTNNMNYMEIIPVIDTEEQRNLIKNASELEMKENLASFVNELREVLKNRQTLPARTVHSYMNKFKILKEQVDDYEVLLGNYLGALKTQIAASVQLINDNSVDEESEEDTEKEVTPVYV